MSEEIAMSAYKKAKTADGKADANAASIASLTNDVNAHKAENAQDITDLETNKADKSYVDTLAASLASGSPKGTYANLAALTTAKPTGDTNIYITLDDGKWCYWNSEAWVAGGIYQTTSMLPVSNLMANGNFASGTTGYAIGDGTLSAADNVMKATAGGATATPYLVTAPYLIFNVVSGTKVYTRVYARTLNSDCTKIEAYPCYKNTGAGTKLSGIYAIDNPVVNQWYLISSVTEFKDTDAYFSQADIMMAVVFAYPSAATAVGKETEIKEVSFINETTALGDGYELTAPEMDDLLIDLPWSATYEIFSAKKVIYDTKYLGRRIEAISGNAVSVLDYGAKGDGATDDSAAIQAALNSGKIIYFPSGTYLASGLETTVCKGICGDGNGSVIKSNADGTLLTIATDNFDINRLTFEGANNAAYTNEKGVVISGNYSYARMTNSTFKNFKGNCALYVTQDALYGSVLMASNCHFILNKIGFYSDERGEFCTLSNCHFIRNTTGAIIKGGNVRLDGCEVNYNTDGIHLVGVAGGNDGHGMITNCQINHCSGIGLKIEGIHYGYTISNVHVFESGITIDGITGMPVRIMNSTLDPDTFAITNCDLVVFSNNYINNDYLASAPTITSSAIKGNNNICTDATWETLFNV